MYFLPCLLILWQMMQLSLGGWFSLRIYSPPGPWHVRQYSESVRLTCTGLSGMRAERSPLMEESRAITTSTKAMKITVCITGESFLAFLS